MPRVYDKEKGAWVWKKDEFALTKKQAAFVAAYNGNASEAGRIAGISPAYTSTLMKSGAVMRALEKKASIAQSQVIKEIERGAARAAIEEARLVAGAVAAKEDRQAFWTKVMLDDSQNMMFRLKASELLGKAQADFVERHEHAGMTLIVVSPYDEKRAEEQEAIEAEVVHEEERVEEELKTGGADGEG